jgi:hypothetical protein
MLSFKASGAGVATFSGEVCSEAFSSVAFSSISEGFFSVSSEGPASALASLTASSISVGFVSASVCSFEALAIFPEGVELKTFTVYNTFSTFAILLLLGVATKLFCAFLLLLPKGLKFLTFLFLQFSALRPYLYRSLTQLAWMKVSSAS